MNNYTPPESETRVQSYIDALLFEAPVDKPSVQAYEPGSALRAGVALAPGALAGDGLAETALTHTGEPGAGGVVADAEAAASPFVRQLESAQRKAAEGTLSRIDTRPAWGRKAFDALTFNVSGLKLALPVAFVEGMQLLDLLDVPANDELASPLFMGSISSASDEGDSLLVVDTARLVMPERYNVGMQESYRHVLTLVDTPWCLAVDSVGGELSLASQQVRWRSEHTRREWLAGTVVDKMCALIDVDMLSRHLLAEQVLDPGD